jgi:hypothetical protein
MGGVYSLTGAINNSALIGAFGARRP